MPVELVNNKKHLVIKRDGRMEPYQEEKMRKVLYWAISKAINEDPKYSQLNDEMKNNIINNMINLILEETEIKIYDKIKIEKLFDTVIQTVENQISRIQSIWDKVATNLLVQKFYKERWSIKRDEYPHYSEVIKKGIQYGHYDKKYWNLTEEEIEELNNYIDHSRDFKIRSFGLKSFMKKYAFPHELPQHAIMRLAIYAFHMEKDPELKIKLIKERYDMINKLLSAASPLWISSGAPNPQIASCVLTSMEDDSWSINRTISNIGLYSKWGGGTACDISPLRCKGSIIGKTGRSSGIIPFIQMIQSAIKAYNQRGLRQGACAVYNVWWHYEIEDFLMLKDEGGSEDNRARSLQYAIKLNSLFIKRTIEDKYVYLFDPKETPELLYTYGEEFDKWYEFYENKKGIRKKKIKARDLAYLIAKIRAETGNLYIFFNDNVNEQTPYEMYINSSNLCVSGDTKIKIKYKKKNKFYTEEIEIQKLNYFIKKYKKVYTLSRNTVEEKNEWKEITDFAQTSPKAKVLKIKDSEIGKELICTPDHQIWTENRGYVEAKDLKADDIIRVGNQKTSIKVEYLEEEIPVYDITVKDNHNFYANDILIHNCSEIMLPSRGSTLKNEKIYSELNNDNIEIEQDINPGLISLCNLSSINILEWSKLDKESKNRYMYNLVRAMDNMIDVAFYPAKEGELSNKLYRPIGIGVFNLAAYFASLRLSFNSEESLKVEFDIMEDIYYHLIKASNELAKERGPFSKFYESKWSKGWLPIDKFKNIFDKYSDDYQKERWKKLRENILNSGVRFITHGAIAPTATSASCIEEGATESINPVKDIIATKTGTLHGKLLVPGITEYGANYDICWDVDNTMLLRHAQIRQIFLDQAQSIDLYYENPDSAFEFFKDIIIANNLGLKSLYYANIAKAKEKEVCESCSS